MRLGFGTTQRLSQALKRGASQNMVVAAIPVVWVVGMMVVVVTVV